MFGLSGMANAATAATGMLAARSGPVTGLPNASTIASPIAASAGNTSNLPNYLSSNPLPQGSPWGTFTANNTDYYTTWPDTGVTRHYSWSIATGPCAPDGVETQCDLINGQYPGPLIEANWGDWIEIEVTNNLPEDGTAIHFHGFLQKGSQWMDGVPGVSQCPIAPGTSFTYRFRAELYGTSFYHSHYDMQAASGLAGPVVIYGPQTIPYEKDVGPVLLADWYHQYYPVLVDKLMAPIPRQTIPASQNNLINGQNPFTNDSDASVAEFSFQSGQVHRMRLINGGISATQKFTIDNHTFTVIANDFVPIHPYDTDHVTLAPGQRADVLVKATGQPTDAVWMRSWIAPCSQASEVLEAKAAIFYEWADTSSAPTSQAGPNAYDTFCGNAPLEQTKPFFPIPVDDPEWDEIVPITAQSNGTHLLWYMADRTMRVDYNNPVLLQSKLSNLDFNEIRNVHNYGSNSSLRLVVQNAGEMPHPMHLHGHNMFVLAEGECNHYDSTPCWDGHITNADNPLRRDVQILLPGHYIVVQWTLDNPGVWPFHCHNSWHGSAGFIMLSLENPDDVAKLEIPATMAQTCRDWATFTGEDVVMQIDDGL